MILSLMLLNVNEKVSFERYYHIVLPLLLALVVALSLRLITAGKFFVSSVTSIPGVKLNFDRRFVATENRECRVPTDRAITEAAATAAFFF